MDQEVAKTLGELELKLQELERELTAVGRHQQPTDPARAPGKLVDEAVEHDSERYAEEQAIADHEGFGGAAVFGGEEVPAQGGAAQERDWTDIRETAYGEIPPAPALPVASSHPHAPGTSPSSYEPPRSPYPSPQSPSSSPQSPSSPSSSSPSSPSPPSSPPSSSPQSPSFLPSSPQSSSPPSSSPPSPSPPSPSPPSPSPPDHRPRSPLPPSLSPSPPIPPPAPYPPGPPPSPMMERESIELAELVRFGEKLKSTMEELIDEYSRLLSSQRPA